MVFLAQPGINEYDSTLTPSSLLCEQNEILGDIIQLQQSAQADILSSLDVELEDFVLVPPQQQQQVGRRKWQQKQFSLVVLVVIENYRCSFFDQLPVPHWHGHM